MRRNSRIGQLAKSTALSNLFYSTGIPVCILVLKKCKKADDVFFINATGHFDKGKRQNSLGENHIKSIIGTYKYRKERERYSRKVSMEEIEKNGYNLNISRYVSTSIDEIQIDLKAVNKNLISINESIKTNTEKHNAFSKALGLPPFKRKAVVYQQHKKQCDNYIYTIGQRTEND